MVDRLRRPGAINAKAVEAEYAARTQNTKFSKGGPNNNGNYTPQTAASTPGTDTSATVLHKHSVRNQADIRSPGIENSPQSEDAMEDDHFSDEDAMPDFMTQTDRYGNAVTPRPSPMQSGAGTHSSNRPRMSVNKKFDVGGCDTLLESLRLMCCCLSPESSIHSTTNQDVDAANDSTSSSASSGIVTEKEPIPSQPMPQTAYSPHVTGQNVNLVDQSERHKIKLLPKHHPDDVGRKCLVLDLDETLVHSSFRAVSGADFVIPVQIEDVVHFVYVSKRPGVDEFLIEMAKHYEIVVYTASLNKYADPLLDLLDPKRTIRTRLFRESCVYFEGNYVKDLSLLDRDLSQSIIVDNSPASYIFHPANAIDCSSYIDDPRDRELDQIARFLVGVKDTKDVRKFCSLWKEWPKVPPALAKTDQLNLSDVYNDKRSDNTLLVDYREDRRDQSPR